MPPVPVTGNPEQGGNWNLEVQVGNVTSQLALTEVALQNYAAILAPSITNSSIFTNNSGTLTLGDELEIIVDADEDLEDGGDDPVIALDIGGTSRTATFDSINSNGNAVFKYSIQNGDSDSDNIEVSDLTVNDLRGVNSKEDLDPSGFTFPETLGVDADGVPPVIDNSSITVLSTTDPNDLSSAVADSIQNGGTIDIKVDADQDLTKGTGTPTLDLIAGSVARTANFASIDGNGDAIFSYTVQDGDQGNIIVSNVNPGTNGLEDENGNDLDVSAFSGLDIGEVADTAPIISSITTSSSGTLGPNDTLEIVVSASEPLEGNNDATITLRLDKNDGTTTNTDVNADGISGGNATFELDLSTLSNDINDSNGIDVDSIDLSAGGLTDSSGISLVQGSFTFPENLNVNFDTTSPTITSVSTSSTGPLGVGDLLTIIVDANEDLVDEGNNADPKLVLEDLDGDTGDSEEANFVTINSDGNAVFTYTIQSGDNNPNIQVESYSSGTTTDPTPTTDTTLTDGVGNSSTGNTIDGTTLTSTELGIAADTTSPQVDSIKTSNTGTLVAGDTLTITVDANEDLLEGSGTPSLELEVGSKTETATFKEINSSGNAVFEYEVRDGDNDSDGIEVTALNPGTNGLEDKAGNDLDVITGFTYPVNLNVNADAKAPTINAITSADSGSTLEVGNELNITLDADEPLLNNGTAKLTLNIGGTVRTASFSQINGDNNAEFTYTIQNGDQDNNGVLVTDIDLDPNGLEDDQGNDLDTKTGFNFPVNLDVNANDNTSPKITKLTPSPDSGTLAAGDTLEVAVTTDEEILEPSGADPTLTLTFSDSGTTGTASFQEIDSDGNAIFTYEITNDDEDTNGIEVTSYNSGTPPLQDASGNSVDTDLSNITINLGVNVDGIAPTADSVTSSPNSGVLAAGDLLTVVVDANEDLREGTGASSLELTIGNTTRNVSLSRIEAGNAIFEYTIQDGNNDDDGIEVTAIEPGTDGLEDVNGNDLDASGFTSQQLGVNVDTTAPTITAAGITASPDSGTLGAGDKLTITVDANENLLSPTDTQPSITLDIGGTTRSASFAEINGDGNAVFEYTVQNGDNDSNGIAVTEIDASTNGLEDAAGNDLDDTGFDSVNLGVNAETEVDTDDDTGGAPANNPPELENVSIERTVSAEGQIRLDVEVFAEAFTDAEGSSLSAIRINDLPENGTLLLGSETVSSGQIISASELSSLVLEPDAGFTGSISFSWNASDGERFSLFNKNLEIDVQAAEEQPDEDDDDDGGIGDGDDGGDVPVEVPDVGDDVGDDDDDDDDDDDIDNEVVGSEDDDTLEGGNGNDDVSAGGGNDAVAVFSGNDNVRGDADDDFIFGNQGDDNLDGGDGDDAIFGGQQNDNVQGGNGNDLLNGDLGDDVIGGGNDNDLIFGGQGNDNANGDDGDDTIFGGQGEDTLNGNNDNDTIFGGQQADIINGGNGDDFLSGDFQEDTLTGGEGSDRFLLRAVSGPDIITDFEDGVDSLVLPTSDFPVQPAGLSFEDLSVFQAEGGTVISFNGNAIAGLTGVDATTITEDDFQDVSSL